MAIFFKNSDAYIWNLLPYKIKNCKTIDNVKLLLKAWEGLKPQCIICNDLRQSCIILYIL